MIMRMMTTERDLGSLVDRSKTVGWYAAASREQGLPSAAPGGATQILSESKKSKSLVPHNQTAFFRSQPKLFFRSQQICTSLYLEMYSI